MIIKLLHSLINMESENGGMEIENWKLEIGPNPQSPIPNPQSPIPILKDDNKLYYIIYIKKIFINNK